MIMPHELRNKVRLLPSKSIVKYDNDMPLFDTISMVLVYANDTDHGQGLMMKAKMKRKITSEMMTTYLPSTLLLMITFATTFFKPYFFEAALTVNLTTMLVMTTIFISKMEGLPSTAYMKMIDLWLILCQLVPFVEVVLFTAKEYTRQDDEGEVLQDRGPGLKHLHTFVGLSRASLVLKFIGKFKTEKMQTKKNRTLISYKSYKLV